MPTLHALEKLTVDHVAIQWEEVPPHLVVEFCGVCKFGSGHLRVASRGALSRWLKGMSDSDFAAKTRCFVLKAQEASGNIQLAEQRILFDEGSGKLVRPLLHGTFNPDSIQIQSGLVRLHARVNLD